MSYAVMRRASSVRPSVNVCANRFFSQINGWIATKLAYDGPRWACIQDVLKVKVKVKGHVKHHYTLFPDSLSGSKIKCLNVIMSYSVTDGLV